MGLIYYIVMMEDRQGLPSKKIHNQQQLHKNKSNRVFILQYSPERSKSKKKNHYDSINSISNASQLIASQKSIKEERHNIISHRNNLDRLTTLISKSRSNNSSLGESGCEKLVKVVDRILKIKCLQAQALQKLKRHSMFCSSTNYQLFVQSKHIKSMPKQIDKANLNSLSKINENQNLQFSSKSSQFSLGFNKSIQQKERNRNQQLNDSLARCLQSPSKLDCFKFKSRELIVTCETLKSQKQLMCIPQIGFYGSTNIELKMHRSQQPICNLNELALQHKPLFNQSQLQFLHLCHLKSQSIQQPLQSQTDFIYPNISEIKLEQKPKPSKIKPDFALPTSILEKDGFCSKYIAQNEKKTVSKKQKKRTILSSKQIAEQMLFGHNIQQKAIAKREVVEIKRQNKKIRVSSLPKIKFTYKSQQKQITQCISPAFKQTIINKNPLSNLKSTPKKHQQKIKIETQSTFGSTKDILNSYKHDPPQFQSSPNIQKPPVLNFPPQKIVSKPLIHKPHLVLSPSGKNCLFIKNDHYYAQTNYKQPKNLQFANRETRERIITQLPSFGKGVEYVGAQTQQAGCCLIQRYNRSKSLNEQGLITHWF